MSSPTTTSATGKVMLAYFSRPGENYWEGGRRTLTVGNTERLARLIEERCSTSPTAYRIEAREPYPTSYDATVARNVQEEQDDARPPLARSLPDLTGVDTLLLGSPVWNVRAPMIMRTFVEGLALDDVRVLPCVSYAVSEMGRVESDYRMWLPRAAVGTGLAVRGEDVTSSGDDVTAWLRRNRLV